MKKEQIKVQLPVKRQIPGSNGQYYVRVMSADEWCKILKWLLEHSYENVHHLTENDVPAHPNIVAIQENPRSFGLTNITCMACASMAGYYPITFDEFCIRSRWDKDVLRIDIQSDSLNIFCQDLDLRCDDASYYYCYKLVFDEQNKDMLMKELTEGKEKNELNFLKVINKNFYFGSHIEDWFELADFETFCKEHKVKYYKRRVKLKKKVLEG